MSLTSSNTKLNKDVDQTVRRAHAAIVRDIEQLYLLISQGEGGFSNESPGSVSQDSTTDGMGVEGNQGDYRFSPPVSRDEIEGNTLDSSLFLQRDNNLGDVADPIISLFNIGALPIGGYSRTGSYSSGSGTHTFNVASKFFIAYIVAGGAAGCEGSGSGSGHQAGGGGGSGERVYCFGKIAASTLTYSVGAGGSTSAASGADSSITHNAITVTADKGYGTVAAGLLGGNAGNTAGASGLGSSEFGSFLVIRIPGEAGQNPAVTTISYNGAGAVSSYFAQGGLGGLAGVASGFRGAGGNGGQAAGSGAWNAGIGGIVQVYEL